MAKYILTFGTDRPTGSRGGSTFQKAGVTYVIRKRNVPIQKKSPEQSQSKSAFASIAQNWRKLTAEEKQSFADEVNNYPRVNSLGDTYFLTGQQLQQSSNQNLNNNALPQIQSLPAANPIPSITDAFCIVDIGLQLLSIQFAPTIIPAGVSLQIFATRPMSEGTQSVSQKEAKLLVTFPAGVVQGGNLWTLYTALFGDISNTAGMKLFAFGRYIQVSTGQAGVLSEVSQTIV